jgi:hypothetical protein
MFSQAMMDWHSLREANAIGGQRELLALPVKVYGQGVGSEVLEHGLGSPFDFYF